MNDSNNNSQDPKPSSFSESSISVHPTSIMVNAMDTGEEQIDFEPSEEDNYKNFEQPRLVNPRQLVVQGLVQAYPFLVKV